MPSRSWASRGRDPVTNIPDENELFARPLPVNDIDLAFGGSMERLLPRYRSLPEEYQQESAPFCRLASKWFFSGLDTKTLKPKEGIDAQAALRHCAAIMRSFEPKHEHKIAGVGWLLSQWFEEPAHG